MQRIVERAVLDQPLRRAKAQKGGRDSGELASVCIVMPFHILEGRGGGAEVQAWLLAKELVRRGVRVTYVAQSVGGRSGRLEEIEGVCVRWVPNAHRFRWANARAYFHAISQANAQIVIQRMTDFNTGVIGLWCRLRGRRFIWICSDNQLVVKWCFLRRQRELNATVRPVLVKRLVLSLNAAITDLTRNWGMKQIALAFTQNEIQRELLARDFGLSSERIISGHVVPETIPEASARLDKPLALWAGNLGPNKRPEKFLELARLAGSTPLRFVMLGGHGDADYVDGLMRSAPENLEWHGRVDFDEALDWFDKATFLVNTSISEGFPNTFIQAWLRGVPVLSLGADPDGLVRTEGLGVVSDGLSEMLSAMYGLIEDREQYSRLAKTVRAYSASRYSIASATDHLLTRIEALKQ